MTDDGSAASPLGAHLGTTVLRACARLPHIVVGVAATAVLGAIVFTGTGLAAHISVWIGAGLGVLTWLLCGLLILRPGGERWLMVQARWERLDVDDLFAPEVAGDLSSASLDLSPYDFYRASGLPGINAWSIGVRSIGLSPLFIDGWGPEASPRDVAAVLAHEIGHHRGGRLRYSAVLLWLLWPGLLGASFLDGLRTTSREERAWQVMGALVALVLFLAAVNWARTNPWAFLLVILLLVILVGLRYIGARVQRAEEYRADQFAARSGYGPALADVLEYWDSIHVSAPSWKRPFAAHPPLADRARALRESDRASSLGTDPGPPPDAA